MFNFGNSTGFGGGFGQNTLANKPATSTFAGTGTSIFGAPANTGGFGATATPAASVFGQPQTSATSNIFGGGGFNQAKPATGNIFGQTQTSTLFGQPNRLPGAGTGSIFGASQATTAAVSPFSTAGQAQPQGTSIQFQPITGSDTMMRNGVASPISTRNQCITCMKEYENKSLEELRLEDYQLGRKGPTQAGMFGGVQQQQQQQQQSQAAGGIFGGTLGQAAGAASSFGQPAPAFGATAQPTSGGLFSSLNQPKPQTSFFPSAGTQQSAFGNTATPFSLNTATSQPTSLFPSSSTGGGGGFGATSFAFPSTSQPQQPSMGGLFGPKTTTTAASTPFGGFNTSTATNPSKPGQLFGQTSTSFGTPTSAPFGQAAPSLFSSSQQQNKPLFGQSAFGTQPTSQPTFGTPNFSSFSTPSSQQPTLNFNTGSTFGGGGIGGSSFPSFGTNTTTNFGSSITNTGLGATSFSGLGNTTGNTSGFSLFSNQSNLGGGAGPNLNVSGGGAVPFGTSPYKDSPLFYNLIANRSLEDMTKPTNPVAQRQIREASRRKTSTSLTGTGNNGPSTVKSFTYPAPKNQTALKDQFFDGFEEEDQGSTIDILSPKSSVKKLNLKNLHSFSRFPMSGNSSFLNVSSSSQSQTEDRSPEKEMSCSKSNDSPRPRSGSTNNNNNSSVSELFIHRPTESSGLNDSGSSESPSDSFYVAVNNQGAKNGNESEIVHHEKSSSVDGAVEESAYDGAQNHPCGVTCTRVGYYISPDVKELDLMTDAQGNCFVRGFIVGRHNYGEIRFLDVVNVGNLNVDETVLFRHKEVVVYPDDSKKPPVGEGINVPAEIRLERVWPIDKTTKDPIKVPSRVKALKYEDKLRRSCLRLGAEFISYDDSTGLWVFKVNHFSKYSCAPEEEEDDDVGAVEVSKGGGLGGKTIQQLKTFVGPTKALIVEDSGGDMMMECPAVGKPGLGIQEMEDMDGVLEQRGAGGEPCIAEPSMDLVSKNGLEFAPKTGGYESTKIGYESSRNGYETPKNGYESAVVVAAPAGGDILDSMMDFGDEKDNFPDYFDLAAVVKPSREALTPTGSTFPFLTKLVPAKVPQHRKREEIGFLDATKKPTKFSLLHSYPQSNLKNGSRVFFGPAGNFLRVVNKSQSYPRANRFIGQVRLEKLMPYRDIYASEGGFGEFYVNIITKQLVLMMEYSQENNLYKLRPEGIVGELIHVLGQELAQAKGQIKGKEQPTYLEGFKQELELWNLCNILWPYDELSHVERLDRGYLIEHRIRLANWFKMNARMLFGDQYDPEDKSLKGLLKKGMHLEACELAVEQGNFILGLNLAQCCGSSQNAMESQLEEWRNQGMVEFIAPEVLEIYKLCTGLPIWDDIDLKAMTTSEWLQHFAIFLWYICPMEFSIEQAVIEYQRTILEHAADYDEEQYPGLDSFPSRLDSSVANTCIHLLKAYVTVGYNLRNILNPRTNNPDCLDYRLSWFLMENLKEFGHVPEPELEEDLTVGFAGQLEVMGMFHWAIYLLKTLPESPGRGVIIDRILERNLAQREVKPDQDKCVEFLETMLKISREHIAWILKFNTDKK